MSRCRDFMDLFGTMVCDTPVPYYDMGISCGLPNEFGDIPPEMIMAPHELTEGRNVFFIHADGDSMEGLGIYDGDMLMMESTNHLNNQDVVYAVVDGQQLLKSYYIDEEGRHWLVPANDKYDSLQLTEDMDIRFCGKLRINMRIPRDTTRNIRQSIMRALDKKRAQEKVKRPVPNYEEVVEALLYVAPTVNTARSWLGACRVLMDCEFVGEGRFDKFCELVRSILPAHAHLPNAAELQRMAVMGFSKPFEEWKEETAPVRGKFYTAYYKVGEAMLEKLPK